MTITKKVKKFEAVKQSEGRGATVKRAFPSSSIDHLDPFVLLDEFFVEPPAGFPEHPHKGFEAVTYTLEGVFRHKDSTGGRKYSNLVMYKL